MHALASLVANPRVKEHLADGEELLVGQASELDYDDYACLLANWERVADEDGAPRHRTVAPCAVTTTGGKPPATPPGAIPKAIGTTTGQTAPKSVGAATQSRP